MRTNRLIITILAGPYHLCLGILQTKRLTGCLCAFLLADCPSCDTFELLEKMVIKMIFEVRDKPPPPHDHQHPLQSSQTIGTCAAYGEAWHKLLHSSADSVCTHVHTHNRQHKRCVLDAANHSQYRLASPHSQTIPQLQGPEHFLLCPKIGELKREVDGLKRRLPPTTPTETPPRAAQSKHKLVLISFCCFQYSSTIMCMKMKLVCIMLMSPGHECHQCFNAVCSWS